jgi:hypothetical protein
VPARFADVIRRVEAALGGALEGDVDVHEVRNVAPEKFHVCVSFRLPASVAFLGRQASGSTTTAHADAQQPDAKRQRCTSSPQ